MDYGKWRYQQQKKEDRSRAGARAGQVKELKIKTVKIGDHDLQIKINHARDFLRSGSKVQFTLQFRGREIAHIDLGRSIFEKVKTELAPISRVERDARLDGRRMTMVLQPDLHKAVKPQRPSAAAPAAQQSPAPSPAVAAAPAAPPAPPAPVSPTVAPAQPPQAPSPG